MRHLLGLLMLAAGALPALASEPGQPLDCSDWVFLEPGMSCATVIPYPCGDVGVCNRYPGTITQRDSTGRQLALERSDVGGQVCGQPGTPLYRWEIRAVEDGGESSVIAYVEDRCVDADTSDTVEFSGFSFDPVAGKILIAFSNRSVATPTSNERYAYGIQRMRIDGFATLYEILHTYDPIAQQLGVRVPYMPEGLPAADYFDTYYGDLATVGDWSQAQPLQCGYPATAPSVGDYITVADPLPDPAPGNGRYYVTAVTYQGERRYGRRGASGVLSGRDPAVLPGCAE